MSTTSLTSYTTKLHRPSKYETSNVIIEGSTYEISKVWAEPKLPSGSKIMDKHQCGYCPCFCCNVGLDPDYAYNPVRTERLAERRAKVIKEGDELWDNVISKHETISGNTYAARLLIGYKVIDVDRSEFWNYIDHTACSKDHDCRCNIAGCGDKFCTCRCDCCRTTPDDMTSIDRQVYEHWLYYAKQLRNYIDDVGGGWQRKVLSAIDAWSLQEKSRCSVCSGFAVVHVYNNVDYLDIDEFYVCLACSNISDITANPERSMPLLEDLICYDLC